SVLDVPAGNTAIEKIEHVDGKLLITFTDPEEWDIHQIVDALMNIPLLAVVKLLITFTHPEARAAHQGDYALDFITDEVEHTSSETIEWTVDGESNSFEVIVRNPGDEGENVSNGVDKNLAWIDLNQYVNVEDGSVSISED